MKKTKLWSFKLNLFNMIILLSYAFTFYIFYNFTRRIRELNSLKFCIQESLPRNMILLLEISDITFLHREMLHSETLDFVM